MASILADITGVGAEKRFNPSIDIPNLKNKVYIVTGGGSGIGLETTKALVLKGAKVYIASRTQSKVENVINKLETKFPQVKGLLSFLEIDLKSLESVKEAAEEYLKREERLDGIVANAGEMAKPYELTKDGIETQFQVNHLSHWLLIVKLAPLMEKTGEMNAHPARVVNLSSFAHNFFSWYPLAKPCFDSLESINRYYDPMGYIRYSQAKLSNILSARELNKRYTYIKAISVHPGFVNSGLYDHQLLFKPMTPAFISVEEGSYSSLYALTSPEVEEKNLWGSYLVPFAKVKSTTAYGESAELAGELWDLSEAIVKQKLGSI